MPDTARDRQISARFVHRLIERERARERERELLKMFNEAAADVTAVDREERDSLLGGLSGSSES